MPPVTSMSVPTFAMLLVALACGGCHATPEVDDVQQVTHPSDPVTLQVIRATYSSSWPFLGPSLHIDLVAEPPLSFAQQHEVARVLAISDIVSVEGVGPLPQYDWHAIREQEVEDQKTFSRLREYHWRVLMEPADVPLQEPTGPFTVAFRPYFKELTDAAANGAAIHIYLDQLQSTLSFDCNVVRR